MIKSNLVAGLLIFSMVAQAQTNPAPSAAQSNTTNTTIKAPESKKIKLSDEGHDHFMFNLTFDNLINNSSDSFYRSKVFNPNLGFYFLYDLPIGKTGMSIAPGIGFTFSKVNLDSSILVQNAKGTSFVNPSSDARFAPGSSFAYEGSSFYSSWLEVPLEIRYRSLPINGRSRIKVAVGIRAGVNLTTNSKMSYRDNTIQREQTMKLGPFDEIASFRYGATFRIGYGALNLFGYYGLNQVIKDSRNYNNLDLRQYSVGVSITGM